MYIAGSRSSTLMKRLKKPAAKKEDRQAASARRRSDSVELLPGVAGGGIARVSLGQCYTPFGARGATGASSREVSARRAVRRGGGTRCSPSESASILRCR